MSELQKQHLESTAHQIQECLKQREFVDNLRAHYGDRLFPPTRVQSWRQGWHGFVEDGVARTGGRGLTAAVLAGVAIGLQMKENREFLAHLPAPEGESSGSGEASVVQRVVSEDLRERHLDALKTSWLVGGRAWHLLRLDLDSPAGPDGPIGFVTRFWENVQFVDDDLYDTDAIPESWLVHSSLLESSHVDISHPEVFGDGAHAEHGRPAKTKIHINDEFQSNPVAGQRRWSLGSSPLSQQATDSPSPSDPAAGLASYDSTPAIRRIDFTRRICRGEAPASCGYRFALASRFARYRTDDLVFDSFSGANGLVVRNAHVLVSIPLELWPENMPVRYLSAYSFATLPSMLPPHYARHVIQAILRNEPDSRPDMFMTWGKDTRAVPVRDYNSLQNWLEQERQDPVPPHLERSVNEMFALERLVFRVSFEMPNPLCHLSIFWPLPNASQSPISAPEINPAG